MGKKRSHQVTRSILKSFPNEAENVLEGRVKGLDNKSEVEEKSEVDEEEMEVSEVDEDVEENEDSDFDQHECDEYDMGVSEEKDSGDDEIGDVQKSKKNKREEVDMGSAITSILGERVKSEAPILSRRKGIERKIEDARLEACARKLLKKQLLESKDSAHLTTIDPSRLNHEKQLRKAATRGVVQLFNAIHQHQTMKEKLVKERQAKKTDEIKQIKQISKTSFLDMLKGGSSAQIKKQD